MAENNPAPAAAAAKGKGLRKRTIILLVLAAMIFTLAAVALFYWYQSAHYVATGDARVDGVIVKVTPRISGRILEMYVEEGDVVKEGDFIARQDTINLPAGTGMDLAVVKAPTGGTVIKKTAHAGEMGVPGQAVAMVADLEELYITANIEETKIYKVKPGQKVEFSIDGIPGVKFAGWVESVGEATLSTFSLLPALNSSGSFTKVVQRIPVKIGIADYRGQRLLPGMNAGVRIILKDR
jgi:multidrug resistance efflux pump